MSRYYGLRQYAHGSMSLFDQAFKYAQDADRVADKSSVAFDRDKAIASYETALRLANESKSSGAHALRVRCREAIVRLGGTLP